MRKSPSPSGLKAPLLTIDLLTQGIIKHRMKMALLTFRNSFRSNSTSAAAWKDNFSHAIVNIIISIKMNCEAS
jgi:hypothetical protein